MTAPRTYVLQESKQFTGAGTQFSTPVELDQGRKLNWLLDVTLNPTASGSVDVFIQMSIDGTNYLDVVHFKQLTSTFPAAVPWQSYDTITPAVNQTDVDIEDSELAVGTHRQFFGRLWRVRVVVAGAGDATLAVKAASW